MFGIAVLRLFGFPVSAPNVITMRIPVLAKILASAAVVSAGAGVAYVASDSADNTAMRATVATYRALPPTDAAYADIATDDDCEKTRSDKDARFSDRAAATVGVIVGDTSYVSCKEQPSPADRPVASVSQFGSLQTQDAQRISRIGYVDPACVANCLAATEQVLVPAPLPSELDAVARRHLDEMLSPYNPPAVAVADDFEGSRNAREFSANITNLLNNR